MDSKACAVGGTQQAATDDTIAWPPGGDRLRRWENQRMMSSFETKSDHKNSTIKQTTTTKQ